jgi:hypothetical protein
MRYPSQVEHAEQIVVQESAEIAGTSTNFLPESPEVSDHVDRT